MTPPLSKILKEKLHIDAPIVGIDKLQGDASYRTYSRIRLADGMSLILMQMPKGKKEASEEITPQGSHPPAHEIPFVDIGQGMARLGLPVPKIFHVDRDEAFLILEDVGDVTLASLIAKASPPERTRLYHQALDLAIRMQHLMDPSKPTCLAHKRFFNADLLNWEFQHFLEYGVEARSGKKLSTDKRALFLSTTAHLTQSMMRMPQQFVHRDYQSRNLMFKKNTFYILDFQDALIGPYIYDVVALLRDSYSLLSPDELDELVAFWHAGRSRLFAAPIDRDTLWQHFHWMTIQRKLKDAGRFVYIDRVKGNPNFLRFIPTSLGYARDALRAMDPDRHCRTLLAFLKAEVADWPSDSQEPIS